jgi:PAT family beta-lactamase induction signal transducer AmpG
MQAIKNWLLIYFHPRILVVMCLGFSSGLPRLLVASTLGALLTDSGVEMATIGLFAYVALPYSFNFIWAPLVDRFSIPVLSGKMGHRRSWMLVIQFCLLLLIAAYCFVDPAEDALIIAMISLLLAFFSASQDIVVDAFRTEYLTPGQYGEGAAMAVFGYRLGMLVAGAGALYVADQVDWQMAYRMLSLFMLVGIVTVLWVKESPRSQNQIGESKAFNLGSLIIAPFADFMQRYEGWFWLLAFILFYRLSDGFIGFMTTPFFLSLGFDKTTIAAIAKLYGFAATLGGMFLGGAIISRFGLFHALWSFGLLQLLANLSYLLLAILGKDESALTLAITLDNFSGGMITAAAIAFMMRLCRETIHTATQYALLSSLASLGSILLAGSAGWIAESYGWPMMFTLSAFLGIPCLLILFAHAKMFQSLAKSEKTR